MAWAKTRRLSASLASWLEHAASACPALCSDFSELMEARPSSVLSASKRLKSVSSCRAAATSGPSVFLFMSGPSLASTWAFFWLRLMGHCWFLAGRLSEQTTRNVARLECAQTRPAPVPPVFLVARGFTDDRDLVFQDCPSRA